MHLVIALILAVVLLVWLHQPPKPKRISQPLPESFVQSGDDVTSGGVMPVVEDAMERPAATKPIVPTILPKYVSFFTEPGYGGTRHDFVIGDYSRLSKTMLDNMFSSVIVPPGLRVTFYKDANFLGARGVLAEGTYEELAGHWNDSISSLKVSSKSQSKLVDLRNKDKAYMRVGGKYLTSSYNPDDADNMCTVGLGTKAERQPVLLNKNGPNWTLRMDCDNDTTFTSYLTEDSKDVLQPKRGTAHRQWTAVCGADGCTFQSTKNKSYLGGTSKNVVVSPNPTLWSIEKI